MYTINELAAVWRIRLSLLRGGKKELEQPKANTISGDESVLTETLRA